jgi:hypothetical protein
LLRTRASCCCEHVVDGLSRAAQAATSKPCGLLQASWDARGHATLRRRGRATRADRAGRCSGQATRASRASRPLSRAGLRTAPKPRRGHGRALAARAGLRRTPGIAPDATAELRPPWPSRAVVTGGRAGIAPRQARAAAPRPDAGRAGGRRAAPPRHGRAQGRAEPRAGEPHRRTMARRRDAPSRVVPRMGRDESGRAHTEGESGPPRTTRGGRHGRAPVCQAAPWPSRAMTATRAAPGRASRGKGRRGRGRKKGSRSSPRKGGGGAGGWRQGGSERRRGGGGERVVR